MKNELRVPLPEFKRAMGRFKEYRRIEPTRKGRRRQDYIPNALLAFTDGFLSFEAGDLVAAITGCIGVLVVVFKRRFT